MREPHKSTAKVVMLISGLMYGGGQKFVLDLFDETRKINKLEVDLTLLGCRVPALGKVATSIIPYDGRYNRLLTLWTTACRLRRQFRVARPSVVHTSGWDADVIGFFAVLGTSTRQIVHLHVSPEWLYSSRFVHRVRRRITGLIFARKATKLVAVSEAVRRYWLGPFRRAAHNVPLVYSGIRCSEYQCEGDRDYSSVKAPIIGVVARLEEMKGIDYLIRAMVNLSIKYPTLRLQIAGEGHLREALQRKVAELHLEKNVEFLGFVEDMKTFYHSIDVLVLPSIHTEGLPLVILEAMAAGLPIVATKVAGSVEAIRDGKEGLLISPGDPAALSRAVERLIADGELRRSLGKEARRRVDANFSIERCANAMTSVFLSK